MSLWLPCGLHSFAVPITVGPTVTVTVSAKPLDGSFLTVFAKEKLQHTVS
jgi:hypothetical protein